MAKMRITGENVFEKDASYEKLRPKQKRYAKKGWFLGNFLCKVGRILEVVAAPQKCLNTLEIVFEWVFGIDTDVCEI